MDVGCTCKLSRLSLIVRGQQNGIVTATRPAVSELELLPCLRGGTQRSPLDETVEILHHAQTVVSGFQVPGNGTQCLATNSILFFFPFRKNHQFAWRANQ